MGYKAIPSALVRQLVYEKENSEFRPVKLRLKTDLVSYPARAEGLVNIYKAMPAFPKGICLKVNLRAQLEFELAYYDVTVYHVSHYATKSPPILF